MVTLYHVCSMYVCKNVCVSLTLRCVPISENETCVNYFANVTSFAPDVGHNNTYIVNAFETATSALQGTGLDVNPSCFTILEWIKCFYRLPPCVDTKLILPCPTACGAIFEFFIHCYPLIEDALSDHNVSNQFGQLRCLVAESYYPGYKGGHFVVGDSECFGLTSTITSAIAPTSTITG